MTEDLQKYSLFIKNSKIFVGRILKRDSKTRKVELELNNQKKTICKIKDLIFEVSLTNSPVTTNNIELSNLWSNLSNKAQIISINEFINFALNKYEINNYFDLCNLVEKLNIDYIDTYANFFHIKFEQKSRTLENIFKKNLLFIRLYV